MITNPEQVIESLRLGIPPEGFIRHFTVGRHTEIGKLRDVLTSHTDKALLLKANYGSGKSHLLRFVRETALSRNYAISSVTLDAKSGIRFNRMDQIAGEIFRNLEVPGTEGKGINVFFDWILENKNSQSQQWKDITNNRQWNYPHTLLYSPALFIALRAWNSKKADIDVIQDWLYQRSSYSQNVIKNELIYKAGIPYPTELEITTPLRWRKYTPSTLLNWSKDNYEQCWNAIQDLNTLAIASDLKGLVILFDEFEDVIYNLNNITYQEVAFNNLFSFFEGEFFGGISFFAVTPGFIDKCKSLLYEKDRWHHNYHLFDRLKTFEMSPLEPEHLRDLSYKIRDFHGQTYEWDVNTNHVDKAIIKVLKRTSHSAVQNRTRLTICEVVKCLDNLLEDEN